MDKTYKVGGDNILEAAKGLDQGQAVHFASKVQEGLDR